MLGVVWIRRIWATKRKGREVGIRAMELVKNGPFDTIMACQRPALCGTVMVSSCFRGVGFTHGHVLATLPSSLVAGSWPGHSDPLSDILGTQQGRASAHYDETRMEDIHMGSNESLGMSWTENYTSGLSMRWKELLRDVAPVS